MSIVAADLIFYSAASVPTDDTSTTGGAIAVTSRVALTQFSSAAKLALISDGADVRSVDIVGRLADGTVATETVVLTGAVEVLSVNTYERILSVTIQTSSGTRTVTGKQGSGGSTSFTIIPNELKQHIQFQKSTSESSTAVRYEKQFGLNNHGSLALLNAQVTLTADPTANIKIGLALAVNDTITIANRKVVPSSISFVDDSVAQNVPGTDLAFSAKIGVWIEQTLLANAAATKSTFTLQLSGSTT